MTSRIPGFVNPNRAIEEDEPVKKSDPRTGRQDATVENLTRPVPVSVRMVDEAVGKVVSARGLPVDKAAVFKDKLSTDVSGPLMNAFYSSKGAVARAAVMGVVKKDLVVNQVLTDDEILQLEIYAPEFRLRFHNRDSHDHAMAAVTRMIDHRLIASRLPVGVPTSDIGGNPLTVVKEGKGWVHVCGPVVDTKDPMRHRMRRMEAERLVDESPRDHVRMLARRYLESDEVLICSKKVQDCKYGTPLGISLHVYDIPMREWPAIMTKKGMSVVEGCLLFSDSFFQSTEGLLGVSKARYEIDVDKDTFKMGFGGSPSWWYEHSFSQYILYGCDQTMVTKDGVFSYKIVERRGDTLFFRILRMDSYSGSFDSRVASFKTPGVPMVKVDGFKLSAARAGSYRPMERQQYHFPRNLWFEMVAQASEDFERGVMDYNKMYNHYRTVSVKHTINAVLVMGGDRVGADELVPLVVHSCLAAAALCMLGQRESRAMTQLELSRRARLSESTGKKVLLALSAMVKVAALAPLYPLKMMSESLKHLHYSQLADWVAEWQPVSELTTIDVLALSSDNPHVLAAVDADEVFKRAGVSQAPFDHFSALARDERLAAVVSKVCPHIQLPESDPSVKASDASSETMVEESTEAVSVAKADRTALRVAAIQEHIDETHMQNRAIASTCADAYRVLSAAGVPNRAMLQKNSELFGDPDYWRVENGVIVESVLGLPVDGFPYSAVYHPTPDPDTGQCVRSIYNADWSGVKPGSSERVTNKNFTLADSDFSGWVLVMDGLRIYNGPEIVSSLEKALKLPHDYDVHLMWGPPGCGKTRSIIHDAKPDGSDVIMCPVKESIEDTKVKLLELHENFPDPKLRVRTVDSYLVNYLVAKRTSSLKATRLLADECFMAHAGKWYAAAALLGVREVWAYGDDQQIPHVPRAQCSKLYVKLRHDFVKNVWLTYRCPATAVAAWGYVYNWRVRTHSDKLGEMVRVADTRGRSVPKGCVMMCMYQADKKEIRKLYPDDLGHIQMCTVKEAEKKFIITAHESEGKTFPHVWMHRFDSRMRTDKRSLFDQQSYVLVAMSRHTDGFLYRCPPNVKDLITAGIDRARDPRRVAAARDLASKGESKEKL